MSRKLLLAGLAIIAVVAPHSLYAGETASPPAIIVRVKSIDALVDNFKLLAGLAGREEAAGQIADLIKTQIGDKGLAGIDMAKPFAAYARLGEKPDDVTGAVLIPIADERAFIQMLEGLQFKIKKDADGLYVIKTKTPFDGYVRFAKGYAYVTAFNKAGLDQENLIDPANILGGKDNVTASVLVRLDLLPKQAKQLALAQIEHSIQKALDKDEPGETANQKAFRVACLKEITKCIDMMLKDGKDLALNLELTKEVFNLSVSLKSKNQSDLAKALAKMGQLPSLFAGLKTKDAAFTGAMHLALPPSVQAALNKLLDEAIDVAKNGVQDPEKKKQAEALISSLVPTLKGGVIDAYASVTASANGQYSVLAAVKVKDGDALGTTIHDLIIEALKDLPAAQKDKIKLKFDTAGASAIHRFELPSDKVQGKSPADLFGEPFLYVAFKSDALLIGLGKEGLTMVKNAATAKSAGPGPLALYDFDLARFADLLPAPLPEQAKKLFKQEEDGRFRITVEGGSSLTLRVQSRPAALQFLLLMSQKKAE